MLKRAILWLIFAALIIPAFAQAQPYSYGKRSDKFDMAFKVGYYIVSGKSDLWDYNSELYFFDKDDLNSFAGAIGLNFHVNNHLTITLEAGATYSHTLTEYADFVDEDGYPIETDIELSVFPIEASIRITPFGRGSYHGRFEAYEKNSIIPYIGAGVGVYFYYYTEWGDYIDFDAGEIIYAEFESYDAGVGYFVVGGIEIPIGYEFGFIAEYKRTWAKAKLSRDFIGFDDLDIGGDTVYVGFTMSY